MNEKPHPDGGTDPETNPIWCRSVLTRRMGFKVAQGLAERGVVRLVRVAAGVPA